MPNDETGGTTLPDLTLDGLKALQAGLQSDLDAFTNHATDITNQIQTLIARLQGAIDDFGNLPATDWVNGIAAVFQDLNQKLLGPALPFLTPDDMGACRYKGGCIETSSTHCTQLGGSFTSGGHC
jgi:hypothetical protein